MSDETIPEVFPTITVDREYGNFVDDLDLDANKITEHLRNSGLTDEQILQTNIHFRSKVVGRKYGCLRLGNYNKFTKKANIFALEFIANKKIPKEVKEKEAAAVVNETVVHELEHRIASLDKQQAKANRKYHIDETFTNKRMLGMIGVAGLINYGSIQMYTELSNNQPTLPIMIASSLIVFMSINNAEKRIFSRQHYDEYRNRPEELRAENAANNYKDSLISLSLKQPKEVN